MSCSHLAVMAQDAPRPLIAAGDPAPFVLAERPSPAERRLITADEVADRIEVRAPYFALQNLSADAAGHVRAGVLPEQPLGRELGPICGGEAGRHLAILGSIAAALQNPRPERHYYLAHEATLTRLSSKDYLAREDAPLTAEAVGGLVDKRTAAAHARLSGPEGPLFDLFVRYHAIPEAAFARLYKDRRRELRSRDRSEGPLTPEQIALLRSLRSNPYTESVAILGAQIDERRIEASLGEVSARYCAGHFPLCPALPVAILSSSLFNLAGQLMRYRLGEKGLRYTVHGLKLRADNLAFAGDPVTVEADWVRTEGRDHVIRCQAFARTGDAAPRQVGDLLTTLREQDAR